MNMRAEQYEYTEQSSGEARTAGFSAAISLVFSLSPALSAVCSSRALNSYCVSGHGSHHRAPTSQPMNVVSHSGRVSARYRADLPVVPLAPLTNAPLRSENESK